MKLQTGFPPSKVLPPQGFVLIQINRFSDRGRHVRFGSQADICSAKRRVRFTPNSDRESGHAAMVMSALPPKADMCGALAHVCFGPVAGKPIKFIYWFLID
jgi:hypothetical protein